VTARQRPVMMNYVDLRKAFDCIHRPSLWCIIVIIQNLYEEGQSSWNGAIGEWLIVMTGVRQWSKTMAVYHCPLEICVIRNCQIGVHVQFPAGGGGGHMIHCP